MNATISASSPFSLILFGASGHLAQIKIYPALYVLALKKRLPKDYAIVGFSRSAMDDSSFKKLVEYSIREHMLAVTEDALTEFLTHVYYHQGQYDDVKDYTSLADRLTSIEKKWKVESGKLVRLTYYSVPPTVFGVISHNLCEGNVHDGKIPFRCIVEKPVGHDLESFESTKKQLLGCFQEEEIYLLDHYLGKEAVRNVYYLRHANPVLERIFKNTLIHHIEITAKESAGLSGRAGYFEAAGTFRDMFQSHLLMMSSLLTMRLTSEDEIRTGRADALKQFYLPPAKNLDDLVLQAQYTGGKVGNESVPGYLEEEGVADGSRTNTYACMKLMTRISRWDGIPFYLRSGKRLSKKETRISIVFQEPRTVGEGSTPNRLDIILQGEAGMRMHMQTKMGGTDPAFRPLIMEDPLVCVGDCLPEHSLLILEAIAGKQNWFLTFDEVQLAWRLSDPIQAHLDASTTPLHTYKAGTDGPDAAEKWIEKDGIEWI
jgi:glucose-6-phosphate 1-dehydrogenase